jgi:hypothetical protein
MDVFRVKPDGSVSWISSASSMQAVREIVKSKAINSSEEFLVYDNRTEGKIVMRANGVTIFASSAARPWL